mmetsp:Transcript_43784/g.95320  ORF Transcript_43784/g.95320 Transcript_43784/m.95320 type:complete len:221 (-) Transcript_43784:1536-2198(-)
MLAGFVSALARAALSCATSSSCRPSTSSRRSRELCRNWRFCWARLSFSFSQPCRSRSVIASSASSLAIASPCSPGSGGGLCVCGTAGAPMSSRNVSLSSRNPAFSRCSAATWAARRSFSAVTSAISLASLVSASSRCATAASRRLCNSVLASILSRRAAAEAMAPSCNLRFSSLSFITSSSSFEISASALAFAAVSSLWKPSNAASCFCRCSASKLLGLA